MPDQMVRRYYVNAEHDVVYLITTIFVPCNFPMFPPELFPTLNFLFGSWALPGPGVGGSVALFMR